IGFLHSNLHKYPFLVPLIVIIVAIVAFGLINPNFWRVGTLSLILQQVGIVGILGIAQGLVIITAGIDLSVGAILVFITVIMGQFSFRYGIPAEISIAIGLVAGAAMGFANGWMVARLRLPPFIVTLGTWQIILAANFIYSRNETIRSQDIEAQASALHFWGAIFRVGDARVTYGVVAFLILVLIFAYILSNTAWGRHVYAVGDDKEAAELAGVNTDRVLIQVYTIAGLLCGVAAWVAIGRFGAISPGASTGVQGNIQSITAVVIGGISLFGGRGSIIGMFLGALTVGVFEMGLRMAGADAQWTFLLIGVLIIAAVTVDQWIRKVSA
ncbi:MAG: ABC transporter permease, partial [Silicimonas sp.]|nr:ABC transporter permease [Silicimonas sp.]